MKTIPQFAVPDEHIDFYDEIAGILEFDAGMSREDAESTALRIVYATYQASQNISTNDE